MPLVLRLLRIVAAAALAHLDSSPKSQQQPAAHLDGNPSSRSPKSPLDSILRAPSPLLPWPFCARKIASLAASGARGGQRREEGGELAHHLADAGGVAEAGLVELLITVRGGGAAHACPSVRAPRIQQFVVDLDSADEKDRRPKNI
ncbi:unnamed protein product [Urochloa humidicola]